MPFYLSNIVRTELTSLWDETHKEGIAYIMGIVHSHEDHLCPEMHAMVKMAKLAKNRQLLAI